MRTNILKTETSIENAFSVFSQVYKSDPKTIFHRQDVLGLQVINPKNENFLKKTALSQHRVIEFKPEFISYLRKALIRLNSLHSRDWNKFKKYLVGIIPVDLHNAARGKDCTITSVSLPELPGISLISEKSLFHAPPSILNKFDSSAILAENLIHEATHQFVNNQLVEEDWLIDTYDSAQEKKIEIPWRKSAFYYRDKHWPVDRCIHAAHVYLTVARFRHREIYIGNRDYNVHLLNEALFNGIFLAEKVLGNQNILQQPAIKVMKKMILNLKKVKNSDVKF